MSDCEEMNELYVLEGHSVSADEILLSFVRIKANQGLDSCQKINQGKYEEADRYESGHPSHLSHLFHKQLAVSGVDWIVFEFRQAIDVEFHE